MAEKTQNDLIVTRFAPSPTGFLHAGGYRTAIYAFLFARHHKGKFILRIEDTDKERNEKKYEDNILETFDWLNLKYDELYRQSERTDRHEFYLKKLIEEGKAYVSKEEVKNEGDRAEVIRFKNPNKVVSFEDSIRGKIEFDTTELKDFVIAKSMTEPLFHLAVVVDDFEMGVTHVIRGEEHISNTPRQILIGEAIGAPAFTYAHLPVVLDIDRSKLSKRKGAKPLTYYRDIGYLKEALLNYVSLVGWNPGTEQEIFTEEELINLFDLSQVHKGSAIFDIVKLNWVNKEHMKKMSDESLKTEVLKYIPEELKILSTFNKRIDKVLPVIIERISYFGEMKELIDSGEIGYFFISPSYDPALLLPPAKMLKGKEMNTENIQSILERLHSLLNELNETDWKKDRIKETIWSYAEEEGRGAVLWPFRVTLSGREKSTDPFTIAEIIGKEETLKRISK
jgi:glutamyl-tRNA synthetase